MSKMCIVPWITCIDRVKGCEQKVYLRHNRPISNNTLLARQLLLGTCGTYSTPWGIFDHIQEVVRYGAFEICVLYWFEVNRKSFVQLLGTKDEVMTTIRNMNNVYNDGHVQMVYYYDQSVVPVSFLSYPSICLEEIEELIDSIVLYFHGIPQYRASYYDIPYPTTVTTEENLL